MIVIKLIGGLGNQLFQYANGIGLSKKYNKKVYFDISFYNLINDGTYTHRDYELKKIVRDIQIIGGYRLFLFKIRIKISEKIILLKKITNVKKIVYHLPGYRKLDINVNNDVYIDGYFQSELYFHKYTYDIKSNFKLINMKNI